MRILPYISDIHAVHVADSTVIANYADAFDGTVTTPVIFAKNWNTIIWQITKGGGATGTTKVTVEACDDVSGTHTCAIPFLYRSCTTNDTWSEWTEASAAGFTTTAGANQMYQIAILAEDILTASDQAYKYIGARLKCVEQVNNPCHGTITALCMGAKYGKEIPSTVLSA